MTRAICVLTKSGVGRGVRSGPFHGLIAAADGFI